jgi:hypothetical protein
VAAELELANSDGSGTVIYYNLEAYDGQNTTCAEASRAFVAGWTQRLQERNSYAGLYALACNPPIARYADATPAPDAVWFAAWKSEGFDPADDGVTGHSAVLVCRRPCGTSSSASASTRVTLTKRGAASHWRSTATCSTASWRIWAGWCRRRWRSSSKRQNCRPPTTTRQRVRMAGIASPTCAGRRPILLTVSRSAPRSRRSTTVCGGRRCRSQALIASRR